MSGILPVTEGECLAAMAEVWDEWEIGPEDRRDPDGWVDLPTGRMSFYDLGDAGGFPVCCWLLHARRHQEEHDPPRVRLVGTRPPF